MLLKSSGVTFWLVATLLLMALEWAYLGHRVSTIRVETVRHYHGLCNRAVGEPYRGFVHQLRVLSEGGDTNKLNRVLRIADERSMDIYSVWLYDDADAYRSSIEGALK
jgi:hypothetical protein